MPTQRVVPRQRLRPPPSRLLLHLLPRPLLRETNRPRRSPITILIVIRASPLQRLPFLTRQLLRNQLEEETTTRTSLHNHRRSSSSSSNNLDPPPLILPNHHHIRRPPPLARAPVCSVPRHVVPLAVDQPLKLQTLILPTSNCPVVAILRILPMTTTTTTKRAIQSCNTTILPKPHFPMDSLIPFRAMLWIKSLAKTIDFEDRRNVI